MTDRITNYGKPRWLRRWYSWWVVTTPEGRKAHTENVIRWIESWFPEITDWELKVNNPGDKEE